MRARRVKAKEMTLEEWAALPEDDSSELVDGVLVEAEVPSRAHEALVASLIRLFAWVDERGGFTFGSGCKYGVAPKRGRMPDLSVYLPKTPLTGSKDSYSTSPPDIAVEIITATPRDARRDRIEKMAEYARFGIRWYWLVDPTFRTVEVFALGPRKRYVPTVAVGSGKLAVPGCRGLKLDVDKLWALVDRVS